MNNILVVNVNWLGDAIFSTPVFRTLKQAHPGARVVCLCVPRVKEVLKYCPDIDEILVYDEKGRDLWPWRKIALINRLRRRNFDAVFMLHRSMTRALLVYLARIPLRIGYGKEPRLLTHPLKEAKEDLHRSDHYLRVVESYGLTCTDRRGRLKLDEADAHSLEKKLRAHDVQPQEKIVVFNIGGNWELKRWPLRHWIELTKQAAAHAAYKIVFSGGEQDEKDASLIMQQTQVRIVNLAGKTTLGESLALYRRAQAVVSADSGPLHLAGSVGAKVIGVFGPTRQEITGPRGMAEAAVLFKEIGCNKAPCYHLTCANNVCMQSIGVEDVWQALQKFTR